MKNYTKEDVIRLCKENDVKFIRLQFVDIFGILKNVAIPVEMLEAALNNELMFDGSSIEGFVRIQESDMYLRPDPNTFAIFPWRPSPNRVARLICDVYMPDGTPFEGCPRGVLQKTLKKAEEMGFKFFVGPEIEFFLFLTDENGNPTLKTHDNAGYFDLGPVDLGEDARRDMVLTLEDMGFEIEASHHEVAPGQHEIDFKYDDALYTADNVVTFKLVVKSIAQRHGLHATFMPKPVFGINGSGMHTNMSLAKISDGKNAFLDPNGKLQLSETAYYFIGGLMKHAREFALVTNPLVNSYKRLVPGYEAPVYIAWSPKNRSPLIRIPAKRGQATRVELRNPDPASNPYLAFSAVLAAGLDGIKNKITPPESVDENIFEMNEKERLERGIGSLPGSLEEAVKEFEASSLMRETFGEHIFTKLLEAKKAEWDDYRTKVHQWEIDEYLTKY